MPNTEFDSCFANELQTISLREARTTKSSSGDDRYLGVLSLGQESKSVPASDVAASLDIAFGFRDDVSYIKDDFVYREGRFYCAKEDIPAGAWDASKWLADPSLSSVLLQKIRAIVPVPSTTGRNPGDVLTVVNGVPAWMSPAPQGQTPIIYLDRNYGNDSNNGLSSAKPVATFAKALSILKDNKGATIYALAGGDYTLNGANALGILSLDGSSNKVLAMDFTLFCEGYLDLNFSDATASINLVKLNGNIKIQSYSHILIKNLDVSGNSFSVESGNYITINEGYTTNISSKFVNIKAFANIYAKNANIQCNRENSEVKFHTVRGVVIDLRDADITCYRLAVTSDTIGYTDLTGTGGYTAGTEVYFSYNNGNHTINVTGECLVSCWKLQTHRASAITCGRFNLTCESGYLPKIDSYSDVNIHSTRNIEIQNQIAITNYGDGNYANINITSEAGEIYFYNNDASNEYILGAERIKISAERITFSNSRETVPPINGKIVLINTYSGSGTTNLPDIIGKKVIIKSEGNVEINNILPANAASNRSVHITCENLKFNSSVKKIGTKTYGSSISYFDFLDVRARKFEVANGGNEVLAYAIYIKTTGVDDSSSDGDVCISTGAYISAMFLKIDCVSLYTGSGGGYIIVGGNSSVNDKIAGLGWETKDINTDTKYSAIINADSVYVMNNYTTMLHLCPYGNQKAGQYALIDVGVFNYGSNYYGVYYKPIAFYTNGGSVNFTGNIAGRIGGIFLNGELRLYPWDNFIILGFCNSSIGSSVDYQPPLDTNGNIKPTGKITATFDHKLIREFYIHPYSSVTSIDLNDGLSEKTPVCTPKGLYRAISKVEHSNYPILIHILGNGGSNITLDAKKIWEATGQQNTSGILAIQGNLNLDVTVANLPKGSNQNVYSFYDFRSLKLYPDTSEMSSGINNSGTLLFVRNVTGDFKYDIVDYTKTAWYSVFSAQCGQRMEVYGVCANTFRLKTEGYLYYENSRFAACDIVLESKYFVQFNTDAAKSPYISTSTTTERFAIEINSDEIIADLSKFKMTGASIRLNATNQADFTLNAQRGFYGCVGINANAPRVYLKTYDSGAAALSDPIGPNGLSIIADTLTIGNGTNPADRLPFFHCSFIASSEIIVETHLFSVDYGYKRRSAISSSVLGNVYDEPSFISSPEIKPCYPQFSIEVPDTFVDNSAIEFVNSNVTVNTGILDTELRFSTKGLYSDETYKMREINATLDIGRITKHGKISGYNIYDSSYATPINFNLISNIGVVEKDNTAWYAYFNDGTTGQADNDPAKHTNFKFIAHVMHEGTASVTQSYTGANTLWQVVADDKPRMTLPPAPSGNGSYILTCTMTNGTPTYAWITMNTTIVS